MDQSALRLPDPDPTPGVRPGERRRRVRQKLHSPVYASFSGPQSGMVVDLSELLDLNENGFAVQTGEVLEVGRAVALTLDLPETRTFVHGSGEVIWSDKSGREGIRFAGLSDSSRRMLKEWLFVNLLIACANHAARTEQLAHQVEPTPLEPVARSESSLPAPVLDLSGLLSAVDAVCREVRAAGDDADAVLDLITERALGLTGASGAALAFLTDGTMICRARAGEPAPPLGAPVDVKQGLSGECVRSGLIVGCTDTESDPLVDREICRELGIGSILAAPIVSDFRVVGLLEVFSTRPRAFTTIHETVLDRLVETVPKLQPDTPICQDAATGELLPPSSETDSSSSSSSSSPMHDVREALWEPEPEAKEVVAQEPSRRFYLIMGLAVAIAATAAGYALAPAIEKRWLGAAEPARIQATAPAVSGQNGTSPGSQVNSLEDLRRLAEQGDADAQWSLGVRYHTGAGVPQDDAQAVNWYMWAAEQGHVAAQASLGAYYWAGRGVPEDLSKAYFWSTLALAQGDEASKSRLEGLALRMTRAQINAARQQADDWLRQHHAAKARAN